MLARPTERVAALFRNATVTGGGHDIKLGRYDYSHELSRQARKASEVEVIAKLGRRTEVRSYVNLGGGARERKQYASLPGSKHYCRSAECAHDADDVAADECEGIDECRVQCDVLVSTDLLYYQSPADIVRLLRQHGASEYVANVQLPYVGGCGERCSGEVHWTRLAGGDVRVRTDVNTREAWQHSSLEWLLRHDGAVVGNATLSWVPYWNGLERVAYRFRITDLAPREQDPPSGLMGWLAGGPSPPEYYAGNEVRYTSAQVLAAMGVAPEGVRRAVDGHVAVVHVNAIARFLLRLIGRRTAWKELAHQKAGALNANDVAGTAALALRMAEMYEQQNSWIRWWFMNALSWRHWLATSTPAAIWLRAWRTLRTLWRWAWRICKVGTGVNYAPSELIAPVECQPTQPGTYVATGTRLDGKAGTLAVLTVDEFTCNRATEEHTADNVDYGLAGIGIRKQYVSSKCRCSLNCATAFIKRNLEVQEGRNTPAVAAASLDMCAYLSNVTGLPEGTVLDLPIPEFGTWVAPYCRATRAKLNACYGHEVSLPPPSSGAAIKTEIALKSGGKPRAISAVHESHAATIGPVMNALMSSAKAVMHEGSSVYALSGASAEEMGRYFDRAHLNGPVAYINADFANMDGSHTSGGAGLFTSGFLAKLGGPLAVLLADAKLRDATKRTFGGAAKQGGAGLTLWEYLTAVFSGHHGTSIFNLVLNGGLHMVVALFIFGMDSPRVEKLLECPDEWHRYIEASEQRTLRGILLGYDGFTLERDANAAGLIDLTPLRAAVQEAIGGPVHHRVQSVKPFNHPSRTMVMGDDGLTVVPRAYAQDYLDAFNTCCGEVGLTPEATLVYERHSVEMCSSLAWPSESGTVFGPKPGRVLARSGWKRMHLKAKWLQHLAGDARSMETAVAHVPLLRVWVQTMLRLTLGVEGITDKDHQHKVRAAVKHVATPATLAMFYMRYDVAPVELLDMEDELRHVRKLPYLLEHPAFARVVRVDGGGAEEWE
jgi:hypothetical protein